MFEKLRKSFKKAKEIKERDVEKFFNKIEIDLIRADVDLNVIEDMKRNIKDMILKGKEVDIVESIKSIVRERLSTLNLIDLKKPALLLFMGFNGSGKTTTIAKIGKFLMEKKFSVVVAAADTFRAASIEQLEEHSKRIGFVLIKHNYGSDPAAVVFDAKKYAESRHIDFILVDTAGRSHVNRNLMDELKKIVRVNKPSLRILVIDSLTGKDIIEQIKRFSEVGIDAYVFTKVDINKKGGAILNTCFTLPKPILFLCNGQEYSDITIFNEDEFTKNLFE